MTVEDEILKELKWQTRLLESQYATLCQIKFELQNARSLSELTYKIKVPEPSAWERFRYWLRGKLKE